MCLKEDEVQKQRQEIARAAVDRIIRETPRQISMEMYVRKVAFEAFAEGWNGKAEEIKGESSNLRAGSNYTANDDTFPSEIQFTNGRKVGIAFNGDRPYLTIGWRGEER